MNQKKSRTKIAYCASTWELMFKAEDFYHLYSSDWLVYVTTNIASGYALSLAKIIGCLMHDDYSMKLLHLLNLVKSLGENRISKKWNVFLRRSITTNFYDFLKVWWCYYVETSIQNRFSLNFCHKQTRAGSRSHTQYEEMQCFLSCVYVHGRVPIPWCTVKGKKEVS